MLRRFAVLLFALSLLAVTQTPAMALFGNYEYISPDDVKTKLENKAPMHLVDIQVKEAFDQHHLPGAISTYAYPVKSDEEKGRIDAIIDQIKADDAPVVIVCPRGAGGAKRCYDHLKEQGIAEERLLILEKGQDGWPFADLVESN